MVKKNILSSALVFLPQIVCIVNALSINPSVVKQSQGTIAKSFSHISAQQAGIQIRPAAGNKGLGAFATSFIPMGSLLGEYKGEKMTKNEVNARFYGRRERDQADIDWMESRSRRGQGVTGNYLLEATDGVYVDCEDEDVSTWCRFMNHDDEGTDGCNVKAFIQSVKGEDFLQWPRMYAISDIEIGEELCWGKKQFVKSWSSSLYATCSFFSHFTPNQCDF